MIITYSRDDQYKIIGFNTSASWFVKEPFPAASAIRSMIISHEDRGIMILYENRNVVM